MTKHPVCDSTVSLQYPNRFPVCVVEHSQTRKFEEVVNLSESFLALDPTELTLSVDSAIKVGNDVDAVEIPIPK